MTCKYSCVQAALDEDIWRAIKLVGQCFWEFSVSSIRLIWEHGRGANDQALTQTRWARNLGGRGRAGEAAICFHKPSKGPQTCASVENTEGDTETGIISFWGNHKPVGQSKETCRLLLRWIFFKDREPQRKLITLKYTYLKWYWNTAIKSYDTVIYMILY